MQYFLTTDIPKTKFSLSTCRSGSEGRVTVTNKDLQTPGRSILQLLHDTLPQFNQQAPVTQQQRVSVWLKNYRHFEVTLRSMHGTEGTVFRQLRHVSAGIQGVTCRMNLHSAGRKDVRPPTIITKSS